MARTVRQKDPELDLQAIEQQLFSEPYAFDFFQAVRLLGLLYPDRSAVGDFAHPNQEIVRFGVHASLAFPASAIQSLEREGSAAAPRMDVNFMGLVGPSGLLPNSYTDLLMRRLREHDRALLGFLDIFHHRMISLFFRAWERSRFSVAFERADRDYMTTRISDFVGLGLPSLQSRQDVSDEAILYYSGLFGLSSRSALALESILSDFLDAPVEIEQFVGVWRNLSQPDQCRFDEDTWESNLLGTGAVAGDTIWDRQSRARIRVGPLAADRYRALLPEGVNFKPVQALVRFFSGNHIEYELQLVLERDHVPVCELGDEDGASQLGWFTWMKSSSNFGRNPSDTVLLLAEN